MSTYTYIDTDRDLKEMCRALQHAEWLALDTEFIRERTYFPRLALVQLADTDTAYCVDPVTIKDLSPLFELLESPEKMKVLHAAEQDLENCYHVKGRVPAPVFDTQVAAALLGMGEQISYAALVRQLLGVNLSKSESRTDWMKRPLDPEQLDYAADDVIYLRALYPLLDRALAEQGRGQWMANEMAPALSPEAYAPTPETAWERVKGAGKLKGAQLNTLRRLAIWREETAMRRDRPRRWIIPDDALIALAAKQPANEAELRRIRMFDGGRSERRLAEILEVIRRSKQDPASEWPTPLQQRRPTETEEAVLDFLMSVIRTIAAQHRLSPGQIASRSDLLCLIRGETALSVLTGWRRDIAGETLLRALSGDLSASCRDGRVILT